ncbi:MAG: hypothetical protein DMG96_08880 [Acidobacteria bacterium]|nr:MAG: hypothetical protein DMG96_08880 [Acidobacteriota bacterium]
MVDTGGWLSSRRFLVPPEKLKASTAHEKDFAVAMTKSQIEQFPALDEKILEDKQQFEDYDRTYRGSWTGPSTSKKPVSTARLSTFQEEIVRNRSSICEPRVIRKAG